MKRNETIENIVYLSIFTMLVLGILAAATKNMTLLAVLMVFLIIEWLFVEITKHYWGWFPLTTTLWDG